VGLRLNAEMREKLNMSYGKLAAAESGRSTDEWMNDRFQWTRGEMENVRQTYKWSDRKGRSTPAFSYYVQPGWGAAQFESIVRTSSRNFTDKIIMLQGPFAGYEAWPDQKYERESMENNTEGFARWCKVGAHSFDPDDKGRKRIQFTDYSGDFPEDVTAWTCSQHTPEMLRRNNENKAVTATADSDLEAAKVKADRELYTEFLEWKNGMREEPQV
jgi:hypothetical protein